MHAYFRKIGIDFFMFYHIFQKFRYKSLDFIVFFKISNITHMILYLYLCKGYIGADARFTRDKRTISITQSRVTSHPLAHLLLRAFVYNNVHPFPSYIAFCLGYSPVLGNMGTYESLSITVRGGS